VDSNPTAFDPSLCKILRHFEWVGLWDWIWSEGIVSSTQPGSYLARKNDLEYGEIDAYSGGNVQQTMMNLLFEVAKAKLNMKDLYIMLLLHINDDFDDDLLLDAMDLLADL
jgi:hypothetical protein